MEHAMNKYSKIIHLLEKACDLARELYDVFNRASDLAITLNDVFEHFIECIKLMGN